MRTGYPGVSVGVHGCDELVSAAAAAVDMAYLGALGARGARCGDHSDPRSEHPGEAVGARHEQLHERERAAAPGSERSLGALDLPGRSALPERQRNEAARSEPTRTVQGNRGAA